MTTGIKLHYWVSMIQCLTAIIPSIRQLLERSHLWQNSIKSLERPGRHLRIFQIRLFTSFSEIDLRAYFSVKMIISKSDPKYHTSHMFKISQFLKGRDYSWKASSPEVAPLTMMFCNEKISEVKIITAFKAYLWKFPKIRYLFEQKSYFYRAHWTQLCLIRTNQLERSKQSDNAAGDNTTISTSIFQWLWLRWRVPVSQILWHSHRSCSYKKWLKSILGLQKIWSERNT